MLSHLHQCTYELHYNYFNSVCVGLLYDYCEASSFISCVCLLFWTLSEARAAGAVTDVIQIETSIKWMNLVRTHTWCISKNHREAEILKAWLCLKQHIGKLYRQLFQKKNDCRRISFGFMVTKSIPNIFLRILASSYCSIGIQFLFHFAGRIGIFLVNFQLTDSDKLKTNFFSWCCPFRWTFLTSYPTYLTKKNKPNRLATNWNKS